MHVTKICLSQSESLRGLTSHSELYTWKSAFREAKVWLSRSTEFNVCAPWAGSDRNFWPMLQWLHSFPVCQWVIFKVLGPVHQSLAGVAPPYLTDDCRLLSDMGRRTLRLTSNDIWTLVASWTHNRFGDRSLLLAADVEWPFFRDCGSQISCFQHFLITLRQLFFNWSD